VIEKENDRDVVFNIYRDIISGEQLSGRQCFAMEFLSMLNRHRPMT